MTGTARLACAGAAIAAILGAAVVAASVSAAPAATSGPASVTSNSVTFQDSTGEAQHAPDIGTVVVSNDNTGLISFGIGLVNRTTFGPTDLVLIELDTDRNPLTGMPSGGVDYGIQIWRGFSTLWRWDPSETDFVLAPMNSLTTSWSGSTFTVRIATSDLSATTGFRFELYADANPDDMAAPVDFAPDYGRDLWAYEVKLAPTLAITALDCVPEPGRRGKPLVGKAVVAVTRGGSTETLTPDAVVKWQATVGTVRLKPTATKVGQNGVLTSTWKVPKATKAKVFKITVTVTLDGTTITKTHLHRIK